MMLVIGGIMMILMMAMIMTGLMIMTKMITLMILDLMISERPKSFKGADAEVLRALEPLQPYYHISLAI